MIAIIIGTHGSFSEEILKSSEMIFGKQENIAYVTFKPGESADNLVSKYKDEIQKLDCKDGLIFMVDLFGGSPFNAASRIAVSNENMDIVTGISLPMLLETFGAREHSSVEELVGVAKKAAFEGAKSLKEVLKNNKNSDEGEGDL